MLSEKKTTIVSITHFLLSRSMFFRPHSSSPALETDVPGGRGRTFFQAGPTHSDVWGEGKGRHHKEGALKDISL